MSIDVKHLAKLARLRIEEDKLAKFEKDMESIDGLCTDETGVTLVIYCADCVPLYFIDEAHHAIGLVTDDGTEILLHIGINTVELKGQHFTAHVQVDQRVRKGDLLISFDMEAIRAAGYLLTTPMIVCNTEDYQSVLPAAQGQIRAGSPLLEVKG